MHYAVAVRVVLSDVTKMKISSPVGASSICIVISEINVLAIIVWV